MHMLNNAFSTAPMRELWDDAAVLAAMLRFEVALAQAQAACGVVPADAGPAIKDACRTLRIDAGALGEEARRAGTLAIPLVKTLKAWVAQAVPVAAPYVHYGATSQDVCDTALVCVAQAALLQIYEALGRLGDGFATQIERHRRTAMLARTLLQPAAPVSFGWKAAGWLDAVARSGLALREAGEAARVLQFGGANGTLVTHGAHAGAVTRALAEQLGLRAAPISWHGTRDRLARVGNELAVLCGVLGKFGRDVSLLMQSEVAEVFEPVGEGRGGSSAMPHKRNPVACMHMLDAAYRAPLLAVTLTGELAAEHERGLGSWPNALPVLTELFLLTANSVDAAIEAAEGMRVNSDAMQANIERVHGVIYSEGVLQLLTRHFDMSAAQRIIAALCEEATRRRVPLRDLLLADQQVGAVVSAAEIDAACSLSAHLDAAQTMADQVLQDWQAQRRLLSGN
ncbi:3-carboxy-cis,cis-muconate cycloisomerase [Pandoraea sp.]|uniref:3-carboxy-cis,cis-muconate cycloisomerase n=1 Tax=Pandoraea sp. TaxID=1883445 RepID=UPI00121169C4|nr:3-carboxy-cis,cis-muconate cycloisomerase [Pandoraea sp.]TAL56438.1 MAG: 3-carboxy-cis,cis-muconate cycloisomerase [Pandoraea sp.]TAM15257.1 MAG: 3-carboxy-cis,cis-muconate cycloisomerase [Pandoraea sp.]